MNETKTKNTNETFRNKCKIYIKREDLRAEIKDFVNKYSVDNLNHQMGNTINSNTTSVQ